jgi:hypothetical protein
MISEYLVRCRTCKAEWHIHGSYNPIEKETELDPKDAGWALACAHFYDYELVAVKDYRQLLIKYIKHLWECAGVAFVHDDYEDKGLFTPEEWQELKQLYEESRKL